MIDSGCYDVAIVGFGPIGQVAANLLGQRGYRVAVFEVATSIYNLPRAAHFDGEVMRIFQSIGLAEAVLPACAQIKGMDFLSANGERLFGFVVPDRVGVNGWPAGYMFYQPDLEKALQQGVTRFPSVEVYAGHEVLSLDQAESGVTIRVRDLASGKERGVTADYLWGCDGARSVTRKMLGIELEDLSFDQPWLVIDTMLKRDVDLPDIALQICDPARPTTFIPSAGRHRRWEFMLMPGETASEMERPETYWPLLAPWVTPGDTEVTRAVVYSFHALIAKEYRQGRGFILGDAAHQMPPFLGQGMCAGIRDAQNLVWKLDLVRAGLASDLIFDSYYQERAPHVRSIIQRAVSAGQIIQATDPSIAARRDEMFLTSASRDLVVGESGGAIDPRMPRIVAGVLSPENSSRSVVGHLMPQPVVTTGGGVPRRLDDVLGEGFAIVSSDALSDAVRAAWSWLAPRFVQVSRSLNCGSLDSDCAVVGDPGGEFSDWLDANGTALVRPDRYVYGMSQTVADLVRMARTLRGQVVGATR